MRFAIEGQNRSSQKHESTPTSPTLFSASRRKMRGMYCITVFTEEMETTERKQQSEDIQKLLLTFTTVTHMSGCCFVWFTAMRMSHEGSNSSPHVDMISRTEILVSCIDWLFLMNCSSDIIHCPFLSIFAFCLLSQNKHP